MELDLQHLAVNRAAWGEVEEALEVSQRVEIPGGLPAEQARKTWGDQSAPLGAPR